ncbi:MAG: right-handed parallel beta-helix repeat-containing protein [Myxococcales bacterium]|nr:right-handed parallel beta-helix repeat-containing protein [Myxococcales bacterium]
MRPTRALITLVLVTACSGEADQPPPTQTIPCVPTEEVCDGLDNDCDDLIDEDPTDGLTLYADADGDGFGDPLAPSVQCDPSPGLVDNAEDCDDTSADIHPTATEICDGLDNDCDATTVEAGLATFVDADGVPTDVTEALEGEPDAVAALTLDEAGSLALCEGTWFARLEVTADVEIGGFGSPIVDAGLSGAAVVFPTDGITSTLEGITLIHGTGDVRCGDTDKGKPELCGGAVCVSGDVQLTLRQMVLRDSEGASGGGYAQQAGIVVMEQVEITDNRAEVDGGGIFVGGTSHLTLAESSMVRNDAGEDGGGLYAEDEAEIEVVDSEITDNTTLDFGGGIAVRSAMPVTVGDSTIARNSATEGGGVDLEGGAIVLSNTSVVDNTASDNGAGVMMVGGEIEGPIVVCEGTPGAPTGFHGNQVAMDGEVSDDDVGAIAVLNGVFVAEDCDFGEPSTDTDNAPRDFSGGADGRGDEVLSLTCHDQICTTDDVFRLRTAQSDDLCLDANRPNDTPFDGQSFLDNCDPDVTTQFWTLAPFDATFSTLENPFRLDGTCLEGNRRASGSSEGGNAFMQSCTPLAGQRWEPVSDPSGIRLTNEFLGPDTCLDAPIDEPAFMNACAQTPSQQWNLERISASTLPPLDLFD